VSMGLTTASYARLLRLGGFQPVMPRPLPDGAHGPLAQVLWRWRPPRRQAEAAPDAAAPARDGAFAALADLFA
jgi:ATP-dependent RNA helicase SUPV3L1/SUV3